MDPDIEKAPEPAQPALAEVKEVEPNEKTGQAMEIKEACVVLANLEAAAGPKKPAADWYKITPATRLIIVNSPGNPTGGVTPREEVEKLVAGLAAHPDVALMSDEIYSRMLYESREHVSFLAYAEIRDRLILLDG